MRHKFNLKRMYASYLKETKIDPKKLNPQFAQLLENAYYSGLSSMMNMLVNDIKTVEPRKQSKTIMDVHKQIQRYYNSLKSKFEKSKS